LICHGTFSPRDRRRFSRSFHAIYIRRNTPAQTFLVMPKTTRKRQVPTPMDFSIKFTD
jgi:hypothetical protein